MKLRRSENLHSVYVLLFLTIAFFLLEYQDPQKYRGLFTFDWNAVRSGEVWRIVTYQFVQGGPLSLFFSLLILYFMGGVVEEECGTRDFLLFAFLSTGVSALAAGLLGVPLFGSFFFDFTLLFIFASIVPEQVLYIFFVIPVKVKWLAWIALAFLGFQLFAGGPRGIAIAAGSAAAYGFYYLRYRRTAARPAYSRAKSVTPPPARVDTALADGNLVRFEEMQRVLAAGSPAEIDALIAETEKDIKPGVNICPPADYKPAHEDRYCVQCDGFAECSTRYLKIHKG